MIAEWYLGTKACDYNNLEAESSVPFQPGGRMWHSKSMQLCWTLRWESHPKGGQVNQKEHERPPSHLCTPQFIYTEDQTSQVFKWLWSWAKPSSGSHSTHASSYFQMLGCSCCTSLCMYLPKWNANYCFETLIQRKPGFGVFWFLFCFSDFYSMKCVLPSWSSES